MICFDPQPKSRYEYKKACKEGFNKFMQKKKNHVLIEHIFKHEQEPPIGVVIAYRNDEGNIVVGWSLRQQADEYIKHDGFVRAINRATNDQNANVPHSIKNRYISMWERAQRYFKVEQVA